MAPVAVTSTARRRTGAAAAYSVLGLVAVLFALPFGWLVLAALDGEASLSAGLPDRLTLDNFSAVLTFDISLRPILNGLVLAGGSALITIVAGTLCAYPLSRFQLRFKRPFLYTVLFATGLPVTAVMVPVYGLFVRLDALDSTFATTLFLAATSLPYAIWLMKGFIDGVPVELEEAAWVDGASRMTTLWRMVVPLVLPGASVVTLFTFMLAWGNFFVPFVLIQSPEKLPAAVAIHQFFSQFGAVAYGQLAAYSLIYSAPVVLVYLVISKVLGGAFTLSGATKG
ncbi:carbohydrate ABC transporter permease [Streptomyces triticagri]|uniref:Carbohydrate ABC transporter permease n=1 Tax=Streptomyces triticagri TaxID=2293568 RepID=A0A372M256_9ACTN|nr:carbohydrate ABC transporter permease [Streptomyces triticagri]RFU85022.1 carbohydrate ABC transporter permease [Streptomyces triticagri]